MRHIVRIIAAWLVLTGPAFSQANPSNIVASLVPENSGPLVRSLSQAGPIPLEVNSPIPAGYDFPTFSTAIAFEKNSALLTREGMAALRDVATALQTSDLSSSTFQVGSHLSSASSDPVSAIPLSTRRANVVATHLTAFYGIDRVRLVPVGYGMTSPVVGTNPGDLINDRIQLINVSELVR